MLLTFIRKYKWIIILISILFIFMVIFYAINQQLSDESYVITSSSDTKQKPVTVETEKATSPEEEKDIKTITMFMNTDLDRFSDYAIKKYSIIKESGEFRLVQVQLVNNSTKLTQDSLVIIKDTMIISGISQFHSQSDLQNFGVPEDIIDLYLEEMRDV